MGCLDRSRNLSRGQAYRRWVLLRRAILTCALVAGLVGPGRHTHAQEQSWWRLGSGSEISWGDVTDFTLMMDDKTVSGAIQPWELKPDENLLPRLGPWQRIRFTEDPEFRSGHPRIWINDGERRTTPIANPLYFVDNDVTTYVEQLGDLTDSRTRAHYYTIDLGNTVPLERFVFFPPEGVSSATDEPFRPNYIVEAFSLTAGREEAGMLQDELESGFSWRRETPCCPLENVLVERERNNAEMTEVVFPLQNLRFLRLIPFPDGFDPRSGDPVVLRTAFAEMQVYGRGFVPRAVWESQVIDLESDVNFGRVVFGVSQWRREGDELVQIEEAPVSVGVEIRTGRDPSPTAYFGFDDLGAHVEVTKRQWDRLQPLETRGASTIVGNRGPVVEDQDNWSFWSTPLRDSGQHPRLPWGRFFQLRVELESAVPWATARVESLWVEIGPLLADRVVGEVVARDDLQPLGGRVLVEAGEMTDFIYQLRADFEGAGRSGFDALRVLTPAEAVFTGLEMGDPLVAATPDSVIPETNGFTVYLPRRIGPGAGEPRRAQLGLQAVLYGEAGEFGGEVFSRGEQTLLQQIEGGDVSPDLGSDRLLVVASASSAAGVVGNLETEPGAFSPQGDGVNDRLQIHYTLFRVRQASSVRVSVYNLSGQRVWQLQPGSQSSGSYTVEWDGRDGDGSLAPPGIYVVQVEAETDKGTESRVRSFAVVY